ncbi:MAG: carbon-nitrogen hydrolase family protein [Halobacteriaceae archaeon]
MSTVAACQFEPSDLDPPANAAAIEERLEALADRVDLAVFPEYALTGYVGDERVQEVALARDSRPVERVAATAQRTGTDTVVGLIEADSGYRNTMLYLGADGRRVGYYKRELWGSERGLLTPGTEPVIVDTPLGRAGLMTCYDLNVVEYSAAFARQRVDALLVAGAWPASHSRNWELLVRARALDGVRWVVAAGRTGTRDLSAAEPTEYAGQSRIVRPDGSIAAGANRRPDDVVVDIDPATLRRERAFIPVLDRYDEDPS